jgi:RNA polymerase sigma factor (sigma-70 family)
MPENPFVPENPADQWDWLLIRNRCRLEAVRILRCHYDADEVVQEALTRAWRSARSCRTPEAPLPWCLQITRHEAFRLIGRLRAKPNAPLEAGVALADEHALSEPDRALDRIYVGRALDELSDHERLLITLRYEEGCSHPQIAQRLQIPEATARVRLHRAHKRLRSLLEDEP